MLRLLLCLSLLSGLPSVKDLLNPPEEPAPPVCVPATERHYRVAYVHARRLATGGRQVTLRDIFLSMLAEQARELAVIEARGGPNRVRDLRS